MKQGAVVVNHCLLLFNGEITEALWANLVATMIRSTEKSQREVRIEWTPLIDSSRDDIDQ
jgi:hypothetical protein